MKLLSWVYWIATALLCLTFLYSAQMYFFNTEMVRGFFKSFNYPEYVVIPLAIAKVLGVAVVLLRKNRWLTEWAYAGFLFDLVLATTAHYAADHPFGLSFYCIPILFISYFTGNIVRSFNE